jgi:small subunit ribosomal protein S10e
MVAQKDFAKPQHEAVEVPNLQVIKLLTSLKSRGYVKETFNWQWYYWYLTNEGIEYLRAYLHLPAEIVPATLKKQAARPTRPQAPGAGGFGRGRFDKDKGVGPSGDFNPEFVRTPPSPLSLSPSCSTFFILTHGSLTPLSTAPWWPGWLPP